MSDSILLTEALCVSMVLFWLYVNSWGGEKLEIVVAKKTILDSVVFISNLL